MYPASFPGLGRGLDFLLPSFLVSRQEKKVEARWIRPTEYHFNDDKCRKRGTFSGYNDRIIWKRITFLGYSFHRWNVCGAYAIRPYRVTGKRIAFLRYKDLIIWKRITFWIFIFDEWWKRGSFSGYIDLGIWKSGALPPCPLPSFLSLMKEKKAKENQGLCRVRGSWPGTWLILKMYRVFEIQCRGVLHTPHRMPSRGWRMRKTWYVFGI